MHPASADIDARVFCFGDYRLVPGQHRLYRGAAPVQVGSRALDLLRRLVERPGELVSKADLIRAAWPDTFVAEGNLKVNIAALRRALRQTGADTPYIVNIPGRGYRFVAAVRVEQLDAIGTAAPHAGAAESGADHLIGRDDDIAAIVKTLSAKGFLTIVGPAGVGKTRAATAAARSVSARFPGGVCFVDFAAIGDARFAATAVAASVGASATVKDVLDGIVECLRGEHRLLIFDNCEHVLQAASVVADHIRAALPDIAILATSREPFRSRGETIHRLSPLPVPAEGAAIDLAAARAFPAIALFAARADAATGYRLSEADLPIVAEICRRLDGIPLAIELAVPRLASCAPATLLHLLTRSIELLSYGPPQAPIRQQGLMAALDWSYRLLTDHEAALLRLLSVFAEGFTLSQVVGAGSHLGRSTEDLVAGIESLAAKSLLSVQLADEGLRYRLLDTTRRYARERLRAAGEYRRACTVHAEYLVGLFEHAEAEWQWRIREEWTTAYGRHANDLRHAIDWAFGDDGDPRLGLRLIAASIPLWDELSSAGEGRSRLEQALRSEALASSEAALRMKLTTAYAWTLAYADRLDPGAESLWLESLGLAERAGDVDYQLRAHWGLASLRSFNGRHRQALPSLDQFAAVAGRAQDESAALAGQRLRVITAFYAGDTLRAQQALEQIARRYEGLSRRPRISRFQVDQYVAVRTSLALVSWACGDPDKAWATAQAARDGAMAVGHGVSQANALAQAVIPVALWTGRIDEAERNLAVLRGQLNRRQLGIWEPLGRFFDGAIRHERGDRRGVEQMRDALGDLAAGNVLIRLPMHLSTLAQAAITVGRLDIAGAGVAAARGLIEREEELWCRPEVLRMQGLLHAQEGDRAGVERALGCALESARRAGTFTFELRAASSLADWLAGTGRGAAAAALLAPVLRRFDGLSRTRDLATAHQVLDDVSTCSVLQACGAAGS